MQELKGRMRRTASLLGLLGLLLRGQLQAAVQSEPSLDGEEIFRRSAQAVFLVEVIKDSQIAGVGTAFLLDGNQLVSNAHVVQGGAPHLKAGPVSLPLTTVRIDRLNDLALLSADAQLNVSPLRLAESTPSIGSAIWVLGNPEGLERSFSEGIISGVREVDQRSLLQISAPISPGSSGSPVLDRQGRVVGVAVGQLKTGQNLNFAVPLDALRVLVSGVAQGHAGDLTAGSALAEAVRFSNDKSIDFSAKQEAWLQALRLAGTDADACRLALGEANRGGWSWSLAGKAELVACARAVRRSSPARDEKSLLWLIDSLLPINWFENEAVVAAVGTREDRLREAEGLLREFLQAQKAPTWQALQKMSEVLLEKGQPTHLREAKAYVSWAERSCLVEDDPSSCQSSIDDIHFDVLIKAGEPKSAAAVLARSAPNFAWDWAKLGDAYSERKDYALAAESYLTAWQKDTEPKDFGYLGMTAQAFWRADEEDKALSAARSCIEAGAGEEDPNAWVAYSHRLLAAVLESRGVYEQAAIHAKQCVRLQPDDEWCHINLAKSLMGLQRPSEALVVAKEAVRVSDGSNAVAHFTAGSAAFDLKDWNTAQQHYEKASDLAPTDSAAPYNVALCLKNLGYFRDASRWYREVLRRNPNSPDKVRILEHLQKYP